MFKNTPFTAEAKLPTPEAHTSAIKATSNACHSQRACYEVSVAKKHRSW